jgi:hypothetical protein
MQNVNDNGVEKMMFCSSAVKPKYMHVQNFQDDCCSIDTGMENFAP